MELTFSLLLLGLALSSLVFFTAAILACFFSLILHPNSCPMLKCQIVHITPFSWGNVNCFYSPSYIHKNSKGYKKNIWQVASMSFVISNM